MTSGADPAGPWVCAQCGAHYRCNACIARRPAKTDRDREAVAAALQARSDAAAEGAPAGPSATSHLLRDAASLLVIVVHIAVTGLCLYGAAIEIAERSGGAAWVFILGALVSGSGAWYAAAAWTWGQWRAVAVPFVTGPALFALIVVLMLATWSRSGH